MAEVVWTLLASRPSLLLRPIAEVVGTRSVELPHMEGGADRLQLPRLFSYTTEIAF